MRKTYLVFTVALALGLNACNEEGPGAQGPYLFGGPGDTPAKLDITKPPERTLVTCPTDNHAVIDAFKPAELTELPAPDATETLTLSKHIGGRIRAVAAFEGTSFWSMGSSLYTSLDKSTPAAELYSVINSIAVQKIADGKILVAVATKKGLQTFSLDGTKLKKIATLDRLGEINSIAITGSTNFTREVLVPSPDLSLNVPLKDQPLPEKEAVVEPSYANPQSDYIYLASAKGLYRVQPSMAGAGCVEKISDNSNAIKIIADGDHVVTLSEINDLSLLNVSEKKRYDVYKSKNAWLFMNNDASFLFDYSLRPNFTKRIVTIVDMRSRNFFDKESGVISDISISGADLFVAGLSNAENNISCTSKIISDCLGHAEERLDQLIALSYEDGSIYTVAKPTLNKYDIQQNSDVVTIDLPAKKIPLEKTKSWISIWNKLLSANQNTYLWGMFEYTLSLNNMSFLSDKPLDKKIIPFFPHQIAFAKSVIGTFPYGEIGLISLEGTTIADHGVKPSLLSENGKLFMEKVASSQKISSITDWKNGTVKEIYTSSKAPNLLMAMSDKFGAVVEKSDEKVAVITSFNDKGEAQKPPTNGENFVSHANLRDSLIADNYLYTLFQTVGGKNGKQEVNSYFILAYTYADGQLTYQGCSGQQAVTSKIIVEYPNDDTLTSIIGEVTASDGKKQLAFIAAGQPALISAAPECAKMVVPSPSDVGKHIFAGTKLADGRMLLVTNKNTVELYTDYTKEAVTTSQLGITPVSAKIVPSGSSKTYAMIRDDNGKQSLLKIEITTDNKLKVQQYSDTNFLDIAISDDGHLIAASVDNGLEMYE